MSRSYSWPIVLALLLTGALLAPIAAQAQTYPSQDIRLICAFPPGSGADVLVRYFGEKVRPVASTPV